MRNETCHLDFCQRSLHDTLTIRPEGKVQLIGFYSLVYGGVVVGCVTIWGWGDRLSTPKST